MARAAQIYEFNLAANQTVELLVEGGFYKLLAASGNVKVTREGGSTISPLLPGQGERLNFKRLTIQDISGNANAIEILVADESFVDTRIYGNVNVIDGGRLITQAGDSFVGFASVAPSAGLYSQAQLWNPVGNTKWACVKSVSAYSYSGTTTFSVRPHNVALPTVATSPKQKNLLSGSSLGTMEIWTDQSAAILGANTVGQVQVIGSTPWKFEFNEPVLIPPGKGLIVVNTTVNSHVGANYDFYEFVP